MAGPIQHPPLGLLQLLDLQTEGRPPRELAETIAPTLDVLQLLALSRRQVQPMSVSVTGVGGFTFTNAGEFAGGVIVPRTEIWFIVNASCIATPGAGNQVNGGMAFTMDATSPGGHFPIGTKGPLASGANPDVLWEGFHGLIVLPPGALIEFLCTEWLGAATTVNAAIIVARAGRPGA